MKNSGLFSHHKMVQAGGPKQLKGHQPVNLILSFFRLEQLTVKGADAGARLPGVKLSTAMY